MQFFRWLFTVVGGMMILPVVTGFFVDYAKRTEAYKKPEETLGGLWGFALSLAHNPYFSHAAAVAAGFALGLWGDWLLRRFDGSKKQALRSLGYDLDSLGDSIVHAQTGYHGDWPQNVGPYIPEMMSVFTKARKLGFATPSERGARPAQPKCAHRVSACRRKVSD